MGKGEQPSKVSTHTLNPDLEAVFSSTKTYKEKQWKAARSQPSYEAQRHSGIRRLDPSGYGLKEQDYGSKEQKAYFQFLLRPG